MAKLAPQMQRPPTQGLGDANPTYVRGVGLAWARLGYSLPGPGRGGAGAVGACVLPARLRLPQGDNLRLPRFVIIFKFF
jgi:hypothetical protein